jgi:2-polyprenyl-3-methyl-5-hydroxy-6-metoxy-1,4-benzoquinol methylase
MHSVHYSVLLVNEKGTELRDGFPWASLGSGKVVDIGGGSGHISNELARVSF